MPRLFSLCDNVPRYLNIIADKLTNANTLNSNTLVKCVDNSTSLIDVSRNVHNDTNNIDRIGV